MAIGVFAVFGLALTGCGERGQAAQAGDPASDLAGRTFLSTSATEGGQPRELAAGTRVSLWFAEDGRLVANAGCNTMTGAVSLDDGKIETSDGLSTTDMACDEARGAQEEWVLRLLQSSPSWRLDGDELTVTGEGSELRLLDRSVAEPDLPLEGTRWQLDTIVAGETASSVPAAATAYLTFADGKVTGSTGCNSLEGPAEIAGSSIRFGEITMTKKACQDEIGLVENAMVAVLRGEVPFEIESGQLRLNPDGQQGLGLRGQ